MSNKNSTTGISGRCPESINKEEDPNYTAKLEKAIAEKYGKEAVEHPRTNWDEEKEKQYLEELKSLHSKEIKYNTQTEKIEKDGFYVDTRLFTKETIRVCPKCGKYSFYGEDDLFVNKWNCCKNCYILFIEGRDKK